MSTPTGGNAFLHELELNVRVALAQAETSQPEKQACGVPIGEWLFDPWMPSATKSASATFSGRSRPWKTGPDPAAVPADRRVGGFDDHPRGAAAGCGGAAACS